MSVERRSYSTEFKIEAVRRFETCQNVVQLAHELGIRRKFLYQWREQFRQAGMALPERRPPRPPRAGAPPSQRKFGPKPRKPREISAAHQKQRIAELERQLGVKQMEVDFLKRAFEHVKGAARNPAGDGVTTSTAASKPRSRSKVQD